MKNIPLMENPYTDIPKKKMGSFYNAHTVLLIQLYMLLIHAWITRSIHSLINVERT